MRRRSICPGLFTAVLTALLPVAGVAPAGAAGADLQAELEHLLPEHGLSSATVYSLLLDRTGFLWLGTESGLNRYDGYSFEVFRHDPEDPGSLSNDDISFMAEADDGMLWLATWGGGLSRLDPISRTFEHFRARPGGLPDDRVQTVVEDSSGVLWIGTHSGGLSRFDRASLTFDTFRHDPQDPKSLCHDRVWHILEDADGSLWIATGKGLCRFDRTTSSFERFRHLPEDPKTLSDDLVRTLHLDSSGVLWIGTAGGLCRFDRANRTFERYLASPGGLSHDVVNAVFEDRRGRLWIGTRGGGLNLFDRASGRWRHWRHDPDDPKSLSDDDVRALLEDRSGVLWIATRQGGVDKLDLKPPKFELVESRHGESDGPVSGRVRAFAEDADGRLWIGTGDGLSRFDPAEQRYDHWRHDGGDPRSLPSDDVHRLLVDRSGQLWVAAGRTGLYRRASEGSGFVGYRHDPNDAGSLSDDLVTALYQDRSADLWVGTVSGLDRLDRSALDGGRPAVFEHFRHRSGDSRSLSESFVTVLYQDSSGGMWVGTHNRGLNRLGGDRFERFTSDARDSASLSNNRVFALHETTPGNLWVGTGNGLNELQPDGSFRRYLERDGLAHPQVTGILDDSEGRLWLATGAGLSRFDPRTRTFRHYTSRDGLQPGPFNAGADVRRRDGYLCFGGNNGYNCFDPEATLENSHAPPIVLAGFEKLGERVEFTNAPHSIEEVRLSHEEDFFTFHLAALDYTRSEDNRYRYMLEGFDRDWIDAGTRRSASYNRVAPGSYVFRALGANSDGTWSDAELNVAVTIRPPSWQTPWFRALVALALVSAAGIGYRLRIRTLTRREQQLSRRLEAGLADLRRSEERYRLLFERNLAGVVRATPSGRILDCNQAFARILGYDSAEECRREHRLAPPTSAEDGSLLSGLRETGRLVDHEAPERTRDGSMVPLLWNASLVAEGDGPGVIEATVIDVSERRRIEEGLRRAQKLESLGVLAGGIAHDFNNLLMSILGNAELSRMKVDPESPVHRRLLQIETAAQRAAELSQQMLAYSGKGEFVISRLDLSATVRGMAHLLEGAVSKKARVVYRLTDDLPAVEADAGQIEQVVMNLVTNASEALGTESGTITITSGSRQYRSEDFAAAYLDDQLPAGSYVYLQVTDDGHGMDEELQRRVFDPFFTTRFTGRGLGLAAVLGIVRGHRGAIEIESAPDRGSTFTVLLPASPDQPEPVSEPAAATPAPTGGAILVVDDDELVRRVARDMLETLGFEVLTANDGREGLEVFRSRADDLSLVVLDLAMPRMSGEEAFREIRKVAPEARVILASGYDEQKSTQLFAGQGLSGFIQKPYRLEALKEKIRQVLEGA